MCFICLASAHVAEKCTRIRPCGIQDCRRRHHPLLHDAGGKAKSPHVEVQTGKPTNTGKQPDARQPASIPPMIMTASSREGKGDTDGKLPPETSESGEGGMYCVMGGVNNVVALRTIPVKMSCGELSMTINAMLDDGSSFTLLNQQVADQLQLQGPATKMCVCMLGGRTSQMSGELVTMTVAGIGGEESFSRH